MRLEFPNFAAIGTLVTIAACAGTNQAAHNAAVAKRVETERRISRSFASVWDKYVKDLTRDFFVINNISRDSRIINVSFSSNRPSDFVDCGVSNRTVTHPAIGTRNITYKTADSAQFVMVNTTNNSLATVNRQTRLEGRANIYIAPEAAGTLVRVSVKYVLAITVNASGPQTLPQQQSFTVDFTSSEPGRIPDPQTSPECSTLGTLERRLLDFATK